MPNRRSQGRVKALEYLNAKKPQFVPNIYFVRRNKRAFQYYQQPERLKELLGAADPIAKLSYALFDVEQPQSRFEQSVDYGKGALLRKPIDPMDPFLTGVPRYKQLHQTIRTTGEMLERLEPYEARKQTNSRALRSICDLERRFNRVKP